MVNRVKGFTKIDEDSYNMLLFSKGFLDMVYGEV